jgi:hypothetical protein
MPWTQWHCCGVVDGHEVRCCHLFVELKLQLTGGFSVRTKIIGYTKNARSVDIGSVGTVRRVSFEEGWDVFRIGRREE